MTRNEKPGATLYSEGWDRVFKRRIGLYEPPETIGETLKYESMIDRYIDADKLAAHIKDSIQNLRD